VLFFFHFFDIFEILAKFNPKKNTKISQIYIGKPKNFPISVFKNAEISPRKKKRMV
jgi:hypothetical protein